MQAHKKTEKTKHLVNLRFILRFMNKQKSNVLIFTQKCYKETVFLRIIYRQLWQNIPIIRSYLGVSGERIS